MVATLAEREASSGLRINDLGMVVQRDAKARVKRVVTGRFV
jgi:hypothetical protein